mgnify:CR=1 FL=1
MAYIPYPRWSALPAAQTISDTGWYYVSAINTTTGAGTITACGAA